MEKVAALRAKVMAVVKKLEGIAPLLLRLTIGLIFIQTGWGKLHSLDNVTEFFTNLGIPMPHANAVLVACTEFFGGAALILGLGARLAAIPMSITMVVATITAVWPKLDDKIDVFGKEEFVYFIIFVAIALLGPGPISVDHLIAKKLDAAAPKT
ncbi:MAG: DoxX family protein [Myxococcaceae bacterium]